MDDPRLSAEGELALARLALAEGDLSHAAGHLAVALTHAPTMPEVHEVLAQIAVRDQGGIDLFPLDRHAFIGAVVARAHLLAAAGRPAEGLELLAAATAHAPEADWAGVPWVVAPDLGLRITPDVAARVLMGLCAALPDPVPAANRPPLTPYLALARHAVTAHPTHGLLLGAASALARRLGEVDLALDWAQRGVEAAPSKLGEVWLGYAYRSADRLEEALAALERAVEHDPDDLSVYADIAGTLADHGRLEAALTWTDRALERDPTFDCAVHTAHRLRYRRDGELHHLVGLADFQREHPDDSHEHSDLAECCQGQPWLGQLPTAGEAVVDALRRVLAAGGTGDRADVVGELRLSGLEAPSALQAVGAALPGLTLMVAGIAEPDLRQPRRPGVRQLWRWVDTAPEPVLASPSDEAVRQIRQLAHPAWPHPPAAYDAAVRLATLTVDDLLALLVHPPAPPATPLGRALTEHDPTLWVRCVQVWACLGLLHHRTDEPWADSARRAVLLDLVWGVEDWITEAALFALVTAAWVDPSVRPDVARIAAERLADVIAVARRRPVSIAESLARLVLAAPGLDPTVAATARDLITAQSTPAAGTSTPTPGVLRRLLRRLTFWR
ncbi:tetratricopeptide repeat protein [Micromonospora sp. CPCC 206060]|uniref:tetratricopeptide repeat protein n=1 Tax=Micromonospora sp. CPCC 206060 TaxID=3122406 RepID=UPI002FF2A9F6